jgi:hypothetical protein
MLVIAGAKDDDLGGDRFTAQKHGCGLRSSASMRHEHDGHFAPNALDGPFPYLVGTSDDNRNCFPVLSKTLSSS